MRSFGVSSLAFLASAVAAQGPSVQYGGFHDLVPGPQNEAGVPFLVGAGDCTPVTTAAFPVGPDGVGAFTTLWPGLAPGTPLYFPGTRLWTPVRLKVCASRMPLSVRLPGRGSVIPSLGRRRTPSFASCRPSPAAVSRVSRFVYYPIRYCGRRPMNKGIAFSRVCRSQRGPRPTRTRRRVQRLRSLRRPRCTPTATCHRSKS